MHWGGEVLGAGVAGGINTLTNPAFCPLSKQPELKHTAVRLKKADLPWRLLAAAWLPEDDALALRQALQPLMAGFGYASAVPFGHARHGVLLRLAAADPASAETVAAIETLFGLGPDRRDALRYADPRRGQRRAIGLEIVGSDTRLQAFVLAGDIRAEAWIKDLLQQQLPAQAFGRQLLRPDATAPVALQPAGRQVCTCLNVAEPAIVGVLAGCGGSDGQRLQQLQQRLGCGTQCGSCVPTLQRLVAATPQPLASQAA
jgi:assimilatory nitrate reductase catalytic subunit